MSIINVARTSWSRVCIGTQAVLVERKRFFGECTRSKEDYSHAKTASKSWYEHSGWSWFFGSLGATSLALSALQYADELKRLRHEREQQTDHNPGKSAQELAKAKREVFILCGSGAEIFGHRAPGFYPKGNPESFQIIDKIKRGIDVRVLTRNLQGQTCQTPEANIEELTKQMYALRNAKKIIREVPAASRHLEIRMEGILEYQDPIDLRSETSDVAAGVDYSGQFSGRLIDCEIGAEKKEPLDTSKTRSARVYDRLTGKVERLSFDQDECRREFASEHFLGATVGGMRPMSWLNGLDQRCRTNRKLLDSYEKISRERWKQARVLKAPMKDGTELDFTGLDNVIKDIGRRIFEIRDEIEKNRTSPQR